LNTSEEKILGRKGYLNLQDQIGAFLGGLDDFFEGRYNSLSVTGRQKIAQKWRPDLVKIGEHMLKGKPNDIRAILENPLVSRIDGEELGKFLRFAIEEAKIARFLNQDLDANSVGLFHLSFDDSLDVLHPRVPKNKSVTKGYESRNIPRISVATNIDGALRAIPHHSIEDKVLNVYVPVGQYTVKTPTKFELGDVELTGERWITSPTKFKKLASIKVEDNWRETGSFRYPLRILLRNPKLIFEKPEEFIGVKYHDINWKAAKPLDMYSDANLERLNSYKTALALEQDASASGAQIIAITTRNKQLAEFSNVIPTTSKKRLNKWPL
jgi:hypothetical protein